MVDSRIELDPLFMIEDDTRRTLRSPPSFEDGGAADTDAPVASEGWALQWVEEPEALRSSSEAGPAEDEAQFAAEEAPTEPGTPDARRRPTLRVEAPRDSLATTLLPPPLGVAVEPSRSLPVSGTVTRAALEVVRARVRQPA